MEPIVWIDTPSGWAAHDCELTNRKTKTWVFPFKTEEVHTYTRACVYKIVVVALPLTASETLLSLLWHVWRAQFHAFSCMYSHI